MTLLRNWTLGSLALLLPLAACTVVPTDDDDGSPTPTAEEGVFTIYQLQNPNEAGHPSTEIDPNACSFCPAGCSYTTPVKLKNVVVTSPIDGLLGDGESDSFFVSEADGGLWSGILVYVAAGLNNVNPQPGDVVNLTGTFQEFCDVSEFNAQEQFIEILGVGTQPTPVSVDGLCAIEESHEGVLVEVSSAAPMAVTSGPNYFGEVELDSCTSSVLDDTFYDYGADLGLGATLNSATGPVDWKYDLWRVYPRSLSDLDIAQAPPPTPVYTIFELQDINNANHPAALEAGTDVPAKVNGAVVVTGPTADNFGFYVMDPAGGPFSGLYIYANGGLSAYTPTPGDILDLDGVVTEYYDMTEMTLSDATGITVVSNGNPLPAPLAVTGFCGVDESHEGALVLITDAQSMTVTSSTNGYGETEFDGCATASLNDDFVLVDLASGTTVSSVTGAVNYSFGAYKVNPTDAADVVLDQGPPPPTLFTVFELQDLANANHPADLDNGIDVPTRLEGVIVTTPSSAGGHTMFVADPLGGLYSGVKIFNPGAWAAYTPTVGDMLNIDGVAKEYFGDTEVEVNEANITIVSTGNTPPPPNLITTGFCAVDESVEGTLVTITDTTLGVLSVTADPDQYSETAIDSCSGVLLNDMFGIVAGLTGTQYSSIHGVVDYGYGSYKVNPIVAGDLAP